MKVEVGWSGTKSDGPTEQWVRHTVTLEDSDWQAFCVAHPELEKAPASVKHAWLETEATGMLCAWMRRFAGSAYEESVMQTLRTAQGRRDKLLVMVSS